MTAEFHMAFNIALALIFIGLLDPLAWLLKRLLPERKQAAAPSLPRYLDEGGSIRLHLPFPTPPGKLSAWAIASRRC
jgi:hypothetical protein